MSLAPIPVDTLLTPDPATTPPPGDDYARVAQPIQTGLPHRIEVATGLALVLIAPTGLATAWRDADPRALLSSSAAESAPSDPAVLATAPTAAAVVVPPLRLLLLSGGAIAAAAPLRLGRLTVLPDHGGADQGTLGEVVVLGWQLFAGSLRGSGDVGSSIDLAFRPADVPSPTFSPPPINPRVAERRARQPIGVVVLAEA
jgi:hypothetical protein